MLINPYHLVKTYNASNFFDKFSYFTGAPNPKNSVKPQLDPPQDF